MHIRKLSVCALVALLSHCAIAQEESSAPPPLLRGILNLGEKQVFSLYDPTSSESRWLEVGGEIMGYTVAAFDAEEESLTLESESETLVLQLTGASDLSSELDTSSFDERMEEAAQLMEVMQFQEMMEKSLEAQISGTAEMVQKQMRMVSPGGKVDEGFVQFQTQAITEMFEDFNWEPVEEAMTEAYAEVFSQDELKQISAFYTTPTGQTYIENTPEIQAKTSQAMMPAMIEATTKLQMKLARYMQEQRASESSGE